MMEVSEPRFGLVAEGRRSAGASPLGGAVDYAFYAAAVPPVLSMAIYWFASWMSADGRVPVWAVLLFVGSAVISVICLSVGIVASLLEESLLEKSLRGGIVLSSSSNSAEPPPIPSEPPPSRPRLYRVGDLVAASLLGSPLAGFTALAINFIRLGQPSAAKKVALFGLAWLLLFGSLAMFGPAFDREGILLKLLAWPIPTIAIGIVGHRRMDRVLKEQKHANGKPASGLALLGICVLCGAPFVVLYIMFGSEDLGQRVAVDDREAVYSVGGYKEETQELGQLLKKFDYFKFGQTAQVSKRKDTWVVKLIVRGEACSDPKVQELTRGVLGTYIAGMIFPDQPVEVCLCESVWKVRETYPFAPTSVAKINRIGRLFYPTALRADGERLAAYLSKELGQADERERDFFLNKRETTWVFGMMLDSATEAKLQDGSSSNSYRNLARGMSTSVFNGESVEVAMRMRNQGVRKTFTNQEPLSKDSK